jgi:hypothetical protein
VRHVVLEKAQTLTDQPQAHFINHRSMEVTAPANGLFHGRQLSAAVYLSLLWCPRLTIAAAGIQIFRSMDGLADEVRQLSPPLDQWRSFVYCTGMLQHIYGAIDHFPGQGKV